MAYSQTINLVAGDTLPQLTVSLKDSSSPAANAVLDAENQNTWAAIDLSAASVLMRIRPVGSLIVSSTLTMIITNASEGEVITQFPSGTLSASGLFEAEIEINYNDGGKHTVPELIKLKVRDGFD
jgi:hypothetical protein|tara:strand:- start:535 stop:909 length:375 start_codon:yes stop_codon:yes gene_type:complete